MTVPDLAAIARRLPEIAEAAGRVILEIYAGAFEVRRKDDSSPVSDADEKAEALIVAALAALAPDIPVVAEELSAAGEVPSVEGRPFFLVDPLDGTREFINRRDEFTVNIALVGEGVPRLGCVHVPVLAETYWVDWQDGTARPLCRRGDQPPAPIATRRPPASGLVAIASRSHRSPETAAFLERLGVVETIAAGSALKFCRVAEGVADVYPRLGPTSEWDTAAGHAVLAAAGGRVTTLDGDPLVYGKPGFANAGFIAWGRSAED